ncbi:pyridine nucleotide-disulfide oxidoreductase [Rhodococcus sp. ACS1]|uniref:NAD(P)/FAD-dependent oxidoreductase n=1 Tax=Rhodococcus sp. ACS1 TaxID=2028570 RepID=UPI000BB0F819|nr:FAD-dependent oxidoreductase [Rhodococcus sp. ACS1]PBC44835.1 pyridine nucleotide-disulfide oxidoreductase [Rhodococcus sp. ACS1]
MSIDRIVIIGSGQAGFEAAVSLRSHGFSGTITLVGDEPGVPYQRPPLSKAYLHSDPDRQSLALRPAQYFDDHRITLACGKPVVRIDRDAQRVELIDATAIEYDHLILATGARNRLLPVPGANLPGVHYLRTAGEAESLTSSMASCSSLVVIGAGFIGLEVAAAARKKGLDVTVVEAMDRPMARALSPVMSDYFSTAHTEHGAHMRLSTGVKTIIAADGRAAGVTTASGDVIRADAVVVGIGVVPNIEIAALAGLPVDNGIVVDEYLRTPDENISAIGDCAAYPIPGTAGLVRLESVQNAVDQARCLAAQLTGTSTTYRSVPWFWSEQYESKLQMAGLTAGADTHVVRGSVDSGAFSIFCFLGTRLLGVESVNKPRDHMAARKILATEMPLTPEQAADTDFDLKLAIARHKDTHKDEVASAEIGERQVVAS